jgi:hypothetical protein
MCVLMTEHGPVLVETLGVLVIFGRDIKINFHKNRRELKE